VIGLGRIGEEVARKGAAGFGMRVLGYDPFVDEKAAHAKGVEPASSLDELLPACDFVSVHVPLTEETRGCSVPGSWASCASARCSCRLPAVGWSTRVRSWKRCATAL
jgi:3-hydroxyisobutyrate dehydrogenase-like beta-hydroxyacid dehydrogenase